MIASRDEERLSPRQILEAHAGALDKAADKMSAELAVEEERLTRMAYQIGALRQQAETFATAAQLLPPDDPTPTETPANA